MIPHDLITVAHELLSGPTVQGAPLGARLRRSISTSYYAVFHAALEVIASQAVAVTGDPIARDAVRRAITHKQVSGAAREVVGVPNRGNNRIAPRNQSYKALSAQLHAAGWTPFMRDLIELQESREEADYDLLARPRKSDARLALDKARRTSGFLLPHATGSQGSAFLALSTAQPRF